MLKKFQLTGGHHLDSATGKLYSKGDVVVSHAQLDKLFVGKFVDLGEATKAEATGTAKKAEQLPLADVKGEDKAPAPTTASTAKVEFISGLGIDVSDEFEKVPAGHRVVNKGKNYFVVLESEPDEALHDKALTDKQVNPFLVKLAE